MKQLPKIDLYMDQLLELISEEVGQKNAFTKAMINNYVKLKMIDAPVKKRDPISVAKDLIIFFHLKNALQVQDAATMLKKMKEEDDGSQVYYDNFMALIDEFTHENMSEDTTRLVAEVSVKKAIAERHISEMIGVPKVRIKE